jgi:hypothetical protein
MPVILDTQDTDSWRIKVQSQLGQIVFKTLSQKKKHHKNRAGGVAQGIGPELKPQYRKKKKNHL